MQTRPMSSRPSRALLEAGNIISASDMKLNDILAQILLTTCSTLGEDIRTTLSNFITEIALRCLIYDVGFQTVVVENTFGRKDVINRKMDLITVNADKRVE